MGNISGLIAAYYDANSEREWQRRDRNPTEFAVTWKALEAYLPAAPARILDCGGGPGRYAIELARRGYQVTLFDLSAENLRLAEQKAQEVGVELQAYQQGTATDLGRFDDGSFDGVLLLGPLYHLLEEGERCQALREAQRVLAPGGPLLAAFLCRYAAHRDLAQRYPERIEADEEISEALLATGKLGPRSGEAEFIAYFTHPSEVAPLCRSVGLDVLEVLGVEGLVSMIDDRLNALEGPAWEHWVELNYRVSKDASLHGGAEHLLAVCCKPAWRTVLRSVAEKLNTLAIPYKVVGGASLVLHGLPLVVKDVDVETDASGAERFQGLFKDEAILPVSLSESEAYRSHFGRFCIHGVVFEVMGNLQRREGEEWVSTATVTETWVDLEGIPVRVSWLEEETLANIRRGRMERAGQCLALCDPERLLALLRGHPQPGVI